MNTESDFTESRSEQEWQRKIYDETREKSATLGVEIPEYEQFLEDGWFKVDPPKEPIVMLQDFRADPVKNSLSTPSGKIELFSKTVASFDYDDCPGHPAWIEPYEWLGSDDKRWPLHLISNQPKTKLHSQIDHGSQSKASKVQGREPVHIHPKNASERNIKDGDIILIFNDRGACLGGVVLDPALRPGVIQMSTGAWYDPLDPAKPNSLCKHGNANVLTWDKGTSKLGQGPSAHSCLVEIGLYKSALPPVTAHEPPDIERIKLSNDDT